MDQNIYKVIVAKYKARELELPSSPERRHAKHKYWIYPAMLPVRVCVSIHCLIEIKIAEGTPDRNRQGKKTPFGDCFFAGHVPFGHVA